ncbi:5-oxoprolinase subunit PxpA [Fodinicurvata sp. EGI_FJ10296]|uniref:LamB/YcsF family protein n=1 Tax=Fodinicurvata sp. EGI_FJ10296 TaxID=3231908 RepID=UPI0034558329
MTTIDLNSDLGESFGVYKLGNDEEMLGVVTTANVACGFHAGDPMVMHRTFETAKSNGVAVGAHPSLMDLWGFGRRRIVGEDPRDIEKILVYQIGAALAVGEAVGHRVTHVKTHGVLGTMANEEPELATAIARAIRSVGRDLIYIVMPMGENERAGEKAGLRMAREIYADRTYQDNGNLSSRKDPGSVIHDPEVAADRVVSMVADGAIVSTSGKRMPVSMDTICVHGDTPGAVEAARLIRTRLQAAGIDLRPFREVL